MEELGSGDLTESNVNDGSDNKKVFISNFYVYSNSGFYFEWLQETLNASYVNKFKSFKLLYFLYFWIL